MTTNNSVNTRSWPIFLDDSGRKLFYPGKFFCSQAFEVPDDKSESKIRRYFSTLELLIFFLWLAASFAFQGLLRVICFAVCLLLTWAAIELTVYLLSKGLTPCDSLPLQSHLNSNSVLIRLGRSLMMALTLSSMATLASYLYLFTQSPNVFTLCLFSGGVLIKIYELYLIYDFRGH